MIDIAREEDNVGHWKNFLAGVVVGIANVIPGVSGGTMLVVLGVYDRLLAAIGLKTWRGHLPFLLLLGAGTLAGIFAFSQVITWLIDAFRLPVYYAFTGLVLGSVPSVYKKAGIRRLRLTNVAIFLMAAGFVLLLGALQPTAAPYSNAGMQAGLAAGLSSQFTGGAGLGALLAGGAAQSGPSFYIYLVMATALAAIAMILPGISGSLVLLLLGAYPTVMNALATFDLTILLPALLGILLGGFVGLRGVRTMLLLHPQALYVGILGLILGSLVTIWPGPPAGAEGAVGLALLAGCALLVGWMSRSSIA